MFPLTGRVFLGSVALKRTVSQIDKRFFPTVAKTITGAVNQPLDVVEGWVGHGIGCYYSGKVSEV